MPPPEMAEMQAGPQRASYYITTESRDLKIKGDFFRATDASNAGGLSAIVGVDTPNAFSRASILSMDAVQQECNTQEGNPENNRRLKHSSDCLHAIDQESRTNRDTRPKSNPNSAEPHNETLGNLNEGVVPQRGGVVYLAVQPSFCLAFTSDEPFDGIRCDWKAAKKQH